MIFNDSAFSQVLLKDFVETFQNAYWEKYTFQWHLPDTYLTLILIFRKL